MPEYKKLGIVDRLSIRLSEDKEKELTGWMNDQKAAMERDREPFVSRQKKYLYNYDDFVTFTRKGPWENSCFLPGTDLLTRRGWIPVEEITIHDKVFSRNSKNGKLGYIPVEKTWQFAECPFAVRLFNSRGLDITVTPEHRILLIDERSGKYENRHCFVKAGDLLDPAYKKQKKKWGIPRVGDYDKGILPRIPEGVTPEDWYCLWGWYLAEGSWCSATHHWIEIAQSSTANPEKYEEIKLLCERLPFRFHAGKNGRYFRIKLPVEWRIAFAATGGAHHKYIPRPLLDGPAPLLEIMFSAMMKGDGYSSRCGHKTYHTASRQLASDVQEILVKTGRWGNVYSSETSWINNSTGAKKTGMIYHVSVHIGERTTLDMVRVEKVNYHGASYCVTTPWKVVYARMNGKPLFIGQSNLHMPLTALMVKDYHSRLYNIFSSPQTTYLSPRDPSDRDRTALVKTLFDWYLWDYINGYRGIRGYTREIFFDVASVGSAYGIKDFFVKQRKSIVIEPNELAREMKDLEGKVEEEKETRPELETAEEMTERGVNVKPYKEVEKVLTIFEGTRLRSLAFENVYIPNEIPETFDLDHPPCVIVETEMDLSELRIRARQGEWSMKKVDEIEKESESGYHSVNSYQIKQERERLTGIQRTAGSSTEKNIRLMEYVFARYDIDDDGIDEELIVVRSYKGTILKITYLDRISKIGIRPIFKFDCFAKPRQAYSRGVPEFMYPLNEEMDQIHNMRLDYMALQACPFGVYRATSSLRNEPIRIAPGKFIPVDEVSDMKPFTFSANASILAGEEDRLWNYGERLLSTSSISQGIVPQTVGPLRSTSGVVSLLREMEKQFKVTIDQCADSWKRMMKSVMEDLDTRIDPLLKMRILGAKIKDPGLFASDAEALYTANSGMVMAASFDVRIDVASVIRSDEIRRSEAQQILQLLVAPSLLQQAGIVGPKALFRATSDYLSAFDQDPNEFIDEPEMTTRPLTLYQEIQICGQGEIPPMAIKDDHLAKARDLIAFLQTSEYFEAKTKGLFVPNTDVVIAKAAQKHSVLAEMLAPKGLPNPSGANEQNMNEIMTGTAPQQGGASPERTTSRELPEETPAEPPAEIAETEGTGV